MTSANPSSAPAPETPVSTPWGLVILLGALTAMGPLAIDMYLPSLPAIARGLEADPSQAQATVAAFLAGMAVGQPFYGPWSDRIGRRVPLILGAVIFIAGSVACACAGLARSPSAIAGKLGRYMSMASGPIAVSAPRMTARR